MGFTRGAGTRKRLAQLAAEHKYLVMDTGTFLPIRDKGLSANYSQEFMDLSMTTGKVCTVSDVLLETGVYLERKVFEWGIHIFGERHFDNGLLQRLEGYLTPIAGRLGIIESAKRYPLADVRVAALFFALAQDYGSVAFCSNDWTLGFMVQWVMGLAQRRGLPQEFPARIEGRGMANYIFSSQKCRFAPWRRYMGAGVLPKCGGVF